MKHHAAAGAVQTTYVFLKSRAVMKLPVVVASVDGSGKARSFASIPLYANSNCLGGASMLAALA